MECLDDTGFFTTPLKEVAEKTGMSEPEVDLALKTLQELEPYGIFASGSPPLSDETAGDAGRPEFHSIPDREEHLRCGGRKDQQYFQKHELSTVEVRKCIEQIAKLNRVL